MASKLAIAFFLLAIPALAFSGFDITIIERAHALPQPVLNVCLYLTEIGKSEYYLVPALVLALYFFWRGKRARILCKQTRYRQRMARALYVFVAMALSGIIVNIIKLLVGRARPKEFFEHGAYGTDPFSLTSRWHSFPSGHANTMVALVIALVPFIAPRWRMPLVAYAGIIIATRPLLAAHYMSDIMGGALVAVLTCWWLQQQAEARYPTLFTRTAESPKLTV